MPTLHTSDWLTSIYWNNPDELDIEWVQTVRDGGYTRIAPDQEERLIRAPNERGSP